MSRGALRLMIVKSTSSESVKRNASRRIKGSIVDV